MPATTRAYSGCPWANPTTATANPAAPIPHARREREGRRRELVPVTAPRRAVANSGTPSATSGPRRETETAPFIAPLIPNSPSANATTAWSSRTDPPRSARTSPRRTKAMVATGKEAAIGDSRVWGEAKERRRMVTARVRSNPSWGPRCGTTRRSPSRAQIKRTIQAQVNGIAIQSRNRYPPAGSVMNSILNPVPTAINPAATAENLFPLPRTRTPIPSAIPRSSTRGPMTTNRIPGIARNRTASITTSDLAFIPSSV